MRHVWFMSDRGTATRAVRSPTEWIQAPIVRIIEAEVGPRAQAAAAKARGRYSVSKQARCGWQICGLQKTSSGPRTVAVREHQYCPVGEASRMSTCSRPIT